MVHHLGRSIRHQACRIGDAGKQFDAVERRRLDCSERRVLARSPLRRSELPLKFAAMEVLVDADPREIIEAFDRPHETLDIDAELLRKVR